MTDTRDVRIEWYGPLGARIPNAEMDVRVGGRRQIAMEMDTPNNGTKQIFFVGEYRDVDPETRLVHTEFMADADGNPIAPEQMTMTHHGVPGDSPGGQGWTMAIDKLEARVAGLIG